MFFAQQVCAQTDDFSGADVSIRFFDKTVYYPGDATENPIWIRVTVSNAGSRTVRFKLADDRIFSVDFIVRNVKNIQLPRADSFVRKRSASGTVFFREITLEPGEQYSFTENLKDYAAITEPGVYYVEAWFYPELNRLEKTAVSDKGSPAAVSVTSAAKPDMSNRLTLEIRPAPGTSGIAGLPIVTETQDILRPQSVPPDKVVEQTILARQKGLWDQYFLYMDLEEMLLRDPARNRRYRAESAEGRARMLENYKLDLRQSQIDKDIVAIPEKFEIEKTIYTPNEGTVSVLEWFKYDTFREKKRYTYYVRQRDGIWRIYDYTVDNLGTE